MKYFLILLACSSCAILHRVQVQDVDSRILTPQSTKFEFLMSEVGVELAEGAKMVGVLSNHSSTRNAANNVGAFIGLIQMGPRTGNAIYNSSFTNDLTQRIQRACPAQSQVSSLSFIREMAKYPVVSGEILKVTGYCIAQEKRK